MKEYTSKQVQIRREPEQIYQAVSKFSNFTAILQDKVEEWTATDDTCSFKVKGMTLRLKIIERVENELVKIAGEDGSPVDFFFWVQMKKAAPYDTRMRLVLKLKMNMMLKMMIGGKIQGALDQVADQIATSMN